MNLNNNNNKVITPIKCYNDALSNKNVILLENKNKSGIYRWINKYNNNTYVGSGLNLSKRIGEYFRLSELQRNKRPIHSALLKYGHNNFILEILEYCEMEDLIKREQYYLDLLIPEYNILKHAYSLLGFKHSPETIDKLKLKEITQEHKDLLSSIHLGKKVSLDTREKLSLATSNFMKNNPLSPEALANITVKTTEREGVNVILYNINTKDEQSFNTLTKAAEFLNVSRQAIRNAINRKSIVKYTYRVFENKK